MSIHSVAVSNTDTELLPFNGTDNSVPAGSRYAITTIMVCNTYPPETVDTQEGITNFDLHFIKSGDPKSDVNKVINTLILPAGETFTFDSEKVVLDAGDRVVIVGESPTNLSATISYLEV